MPDDETPGEPIPESLTPRRRRMGGRSGRIANRKGPLEAHARPVRPGQAGGRYKPLGETDLEQVYNTAICLLEELGMGSPIPEFVQVVTEAGGSLDEHGRLRFPRGLVEGAIETAAKEWVWHGFDDDKSIMVGGKSVHFGTGGAAILVHEPSTNTFRPSTAQDVYDFARMVDQLDNIHFFVRNVVARDIEDPRLLDINTAYAITTGTTKPVGTSFFDSAHVYESVQLFDTALGAEGEFRKRPFVVANNTFVVPPLRFAQESASCIVAQVETGMPINLLSAGQAGATAPAALAGSLAQALAECLAGLTSINLMSPGHPCVMGLWPFVSDLRTGSMSGGSGEEGVLNAAAAQLANWLGLPSGVAAGMTDSKVPDNQSGYEKGLSITLAGHAGANLVYESAGMLGSLLATSYEALVIDNDMLGAVNRTVRGIEVNDESLSAGVIRDVVYGEGHFLGSAQTLELMQTEYVYPEIADRQTPDDWVDSGAKDSARVAREHADAVLAFHRPGHVSADADAAIRERWQIVIER
ncbi:MAG: methyltransferase [Actinomycetia bacterium]|nr:methyltransferase [Actinomycetes bacterium]